MTFYYICEMEIIRYIDEGHKYIRESDGIALMSVSHFKKLFTPEMWEHNARKEAAQRYLKSTKYTKLKKEWEAKGRHILDPEFITYLLESMHEGTFNRILGEVQTDWAQRGTDSARDGTESHATEESITINDGFAINLYNGEKYPTMPHGKRPDGSNQNITQCLCDLPPGFYPELLIWYFFPEPVFSASMEQWICGISGQSDRVFLEPKASMVDDFKFTIKPLEDFGYFYPNHGKEYHLGPWSYLEKTKVSPYKIQLNTYGWMLEQHGLPPKHLMIQNHGKKIDIDYNPQAVEEGVNMVFTEGL